MILQTRVLSPKKTVRRSIAIALGIICILLVAGLGGAMAYYTMTINNKVTTINQLNATIASLNTNITNLTNEKNQLQTWLAGNETLLNLVYANITQLNDTITNLQNITSLNESTLLYNGTTTRLFYQEWGSFFKYAGYFSIRLSATFDTTVELNYTFQSLYYDSKLDFGTNGTAVFPILPSPLVELFIGNSIAPVGATANVTEIYYY